MKVRIHSGGKFSGVGVETKIPFSTISATSQM